MGRRTWLSPELARAAGALDFELAAASDARSVLLETVERFSLPHLTHYDDRSGMRRSIEGRMPFLDHRLADVVGSLAPESFVGGGGLKRVLRDACADLLPAEVLERRDKIGFFTPLRDMLRAESAWVVERVGDERSRELGLFEVDAVVARARAIAEGNAGGDAAHVVFRALSMRLWAEEFSVAPLA
jgi:asparagine synthase (glutamine-hydrolysing)